MRGLSLSYVLALVIQTWPSPGPSSRQEAERDVPDIFHDAENIRVHGNYTTNGRPGAMLIVPINRHPRRAFKNRSDGGIRPASFRTMRPFRIVSKTARMCFLQSVRKYQPCIRRCLCGGRTIQLQVLADLQPPPEWLGGEVP